MLLQNPNALDSKVLSDFDHVRNNLTVDNEGKDFSFYHNITLDRWELSGSVILVFIDLKKMSEDPTYNINVSGDIKQMLQELGTEKGKLVALHGGGGEKAKKERAAALSAILESRSSMKEDSQSAANGDSKPVQSFSIVDVASASVHGRSAVAAKSASSDKTAARIALHMAGERVPVNAKLVCPLCYCYFILFF